jgi:hypothetical protein
MCGAELSRALYENSNAVREANSPPFWPLSVRASTNSEPALPEIKEVVA